MSRDGAHLSSSSRKPPVRPGTVARVSTTALVGVSLLCVIALTGCVETSIEELTASTPSTGAESDPAESENGTVLTDEQARALNGDFRDPNGAYQIADGTWVKINRDEPLPETVKADIGAEAAVAVGPSQANNGAVLDSLNSARSETGRPIIYVVQMGWMTGPDNTILVWTWTNGRNTIVDYPSKGDALEAAKAAFPEAEVVVVESS